LQSAATLQSRASDKQLRFQRTTPDVCTLVQISVQLAPSAVALADSHLSLARLLHADSQVGSATGGGAGGGMGRGHATNSRSETPRTAIDRMEGF
jgi:hypothetical protein